MTKTLKKSLREALVELTEEYREAFNVEAVTTKEVGIWAINNKKWEMPFEDQLARFTREARDAMGKTKRVNAQGNTVRKEAVAPYEKEATDDNGEQHTVQIYLWSDAHRATEAHCRMSIAYRRSQTVDDCRAIYRDKQDMNSNNPELADSPIQVSFDFTDEMEMEDESPT